MSDESRTKATVYIGGIAAAVHSKILHDAFIPFGEIAEISLPKPDNPNSSDLHRGFGYIEFSSASDATEAIDNMDQSVLYGRVIRVAAAKPSQAAHLRGGGAGQMEGVLGSRTALWEQEGYLSRFGENNNSTSLDAAEENGEDAQGPTSGLEGLDVAGPKAS